MLGWRPLMGVRFSPGIHELPPPPHERTSEMELFPKVTVPTCETCGRTALICERRNEGEPCDG